MFIGLKQWIWEDSSRTTVSVENSILLITVVFIVRDKIIWYESYGVEQCHIFDTSPIH